MLQFTVHIRHNVAENSWDSKFGLSIGQNNHSFSCKPHFGQVIVKTP